MTVAPADTIRLYAAGSLRDALTDVARAFEAGTGNKIETKYGPSGLRKSVRLELGAAPFVLQISGAEADTISVAVSPVE
ncbi:MAG: substrate-binding domain-containing protein [Pseudolabrys sp.]